MNALPNAFMESIHAMLSTQLAGMQTNECNDLFVGDSWVVGCCRDTMHVTAGSLWIGSRERDKIFTSMYLMVGHMVVLVKSYRDPTGPTPDVCGPSLQKLTAATRSSGPYCTTYQAVLLGASPRSAPFPFQGQLCPRPLLASCACCFPCRGGLVHQLQIVSLQDI